MSQPGRSRGRPRVSSRELIEKAALSLMLTRGYESVSVESIAAEAGIGRTTFFRYFGSKSGVIWSAFDATTGRLRDALRAADPDVDTLDAIREAVVSSTRAAVFDSDVWIERFRLLDTHAALRPGAHEHWEIWRQAIGTFVADRTARSVGEYAVMAVAGAYNGVFLAELRSVSDAGYGRDEMLARLGAHLAEVGECLRPLLRGPAQ